MKVYEKPKLVVISVLGNDLLCNSCSSDVVGGGGPRDPIIDEIIRDFGETVFTTSDGCETIYDIIGYCKFSPSDDILYNS